LPTSTQSSITSRPIRRKARGVKLGRKPKLTPHQQKKAIKRRDQGEP
jgi:hypothetical protein